jgi:hypothetical protein
VQAWGGRWCCGLRDGAGSTTSWARGRSEVDSVAGLVRTTALWVGTARDQRCHGLRHDDDVVSLGTVQGWWHRGLGNGAYVVDGFNGLGRGRWWRVRRARPGSGMMVWRLQGGLYDRAGSDLGRSTMVRGLGKFSVENFGILSAWVKTSRDYRLQSPHNCLFIGEPH